MPTPATSTGPLRPGAASLRHDLCVLGVDLGTGSTKAAVIDARGAVLGFAAAVHAIDHPDAGAAEADPASWLTSVATATRAATRAAGVARVDAIGLSGQMHGVVFVATDDSIPRPAMLWPDTRATTACARYALLDAHDRRALANPVVPGMLGPMLAWAIADEPDLRNRLRWALSPKDWLRLALTGDAATEPSDASATLLWDVPADDWSSAALAVLDLPASVLPPVLGSGAVAGVLSAGGAELLGLPQGIPVATGAGDTAAALRGSGVATGGTLLSIGTGAQIVAPLDEPHVAASAVTHRYRRAEPTGWYAMAAIQNAGLALEWVRAVLRASWDEVHAALESAPPGADGVTFHAYLTGERTPLLDPDVRSAWQGLSAHHDRAILLRAALEGVAFALRDGLQALVDEGVASEVTRLAGGGIVDSRWRTLLAAALGRPLDVHTTAHVSVEGAARLAAAAVDGELPVAIDGRSETVDVDVDLSAALDIAWRRWRARRPNNDSV